MIHGESARTKEKPNIIDTISAFLSLPRYFFERNTLAIRTPAIMRKAHPTIIRGF